MLYCCDVLLCTAMYCYPWSTDIVVDSVESGASTVVSIEDSGSAAHSSSIGSADLYVPHGILPEVVDTSIELCHCILSFDADTIDQRWM